MTQETQFASLGLAEPLLRAIAEAGYTIPTPIQLKAIPQVLAGGDLLGAAQTGTGKTAGFVLPILHRLTETAGEHAGAKNGRPRCLILTPTRELAAQVEESVRTYGKYVPVKTMVMFGGVGIQPQITQLRKRLDILVATPGRLLDHAGQRTVDLSGVEILVLDEGDRMLDMGFLPDIKRVIALLPKKRQTLLFSATFSEEIRTLAGSMLNNPGSIDIAPRNVPIELVDQGVYLCSKERKRDLLSHLIRENAWEQVLVFTRTKHGANRLAEKLERDGIKAAAIHGNKSQGARTRALEDFKAGLVPVLVATDIAARGLDIDQLPHVVNFEIPNVPEDYVHRIGRTGRAGVEGAAVSLVDAEEIPLLRAIEKLIKRPIQRLEVEGFDTRKSSASAADVEEARQPRGFGQQRDQRGRQPRAGQPRSSQPRSGQARPGQSRGGPSRDPRAGQRNSQPDSQHRGPSPMEAPRQHQHVMTWRDEPQRQPEPVAADAAAGNELSEAARHQAMPQPSLFSPPAAPRRRTWGKVR